MCGIAGILRLSAAAETQSPPPQTDDQKVLGLLRHRGPDSRRTFSKEGLTLYHSRLQVIDTTENSSQPFFYPGNNDALVYNGEVFNYKDLSEQITGLRTEGD